MHTHFLFILFFSTFFIFIFIFFLFFWGWAQLSPHGLGPAQPTWAGLDPASPAGQKKKKHA
jgi:hypothetical protein